MAKANFQSKQKLRKIPLLITKWNDGEVKGWRAEIADNWGNYKPIQIDKINFEDLSHHFNHGVETHEKDQFVFWTRQAAVEAAKYINKTYLFGKGKMWYC